MRKQKCEFCPIAPHEGGRMGFLYILPELNNICSVNGEK